MIREGLGDRLIKTGLFFGIALWQALATAETAAGAVLGENSWVWPAAGIGLLPLWIWGTLMALRQLRGGVGTAPIRGHPRDHTACPDEVHRIRARDDREDQEGGHAMTWPEAFATVGVAFAVVAFFYVMSRWA